MVRAQTKTVRFFKLINDKKLRRIKMKRRNFVKIGAAIGASIFSGTVISQKDNTIEPNIRLNDLLTESNLIANQKKTNYKVAIKNIHTKHYKENNKQSLRVTTDNLYPFSFGQGDFALQLRKMTNGFVIMNLFLLSKKGYTLVGENIGNTKSAQKNRMSWLKYGIRIEISETTV